MKTLMTSEASVMIPMSTTASVEENAARPSHAPSTGMKHRVIAISQPR